MYEHLFSLFGLLAMVGWLGLSLGLFAKPWLPKITLITRYAIPVVIACAYIWLLSQGWGHAQGGFSSLADVRLLFSNDSALLAGWIHYLAFDLFVGTYIAEKAVAARLSPFLVLPCLFLTFMFGPAGLLLYYAIATLSALLAKKA
jgi:hypothetical protein